MKIKIKIYLSNDYGVQIKLADIIQILKCVTKSNNDPNFQTDSIEIIVKWNGIWT